MKLYHFCGKKFLERIKLQGLILGSLTIMKDGKYDSVYRPCQWLTQNGDFNQSWDTQTTLDYSRCDYRLTISIPKSHRENLVKWDEIINHPVYEELGLEESFKVLSEFGDPENWYVYFGTLSPNLIRSIHERD